MEKIIIYILIIAIGILFDFIKKRVRKSAASKPENKAPKPQISTPFLQFSNLQAAPMPTHPAPMTASPQEKTKKDKQKKEEIRRVQSQNAATPFLPGEQEISALTTVETAPIETTQKEDPTDISAHYSRWRQAIIDAEILQRKF